MLPIRNSHQRSDEQSELGDGERRAPRPSRLGAASEDRTRGGRRLRGRACRLRGPRPRTSRVSHGDAHYTHERARAFFGCAVDRFASAAVLTTGRALAIVTAAQLALLYAWHAPGAAGLHWSRSPAAHLSMHASLLAAALLFGSRFLAIQESRVGAASRALTITGKLACLLGVLLVFAPRVLDTSTASWGATTEMMLADQRLAGLLMLAACPASYVLSGVWIASRWLLAYGGRSLARGFRSSGLRLERASMPERQSDPKRLPNDTPRPPGELEELERIWALPPGWRRITAVNNTFVGLFYIGAALCCSFCSRACWRC